MHIWDKQIQLGLCVRYTIEFNQLQISCFLHEMNQFEAHLMVSYREVDSKVPGMAIQS